MKICSTVFVALYGMGFAQAGSTPCIRDNCYNAVAATTGNPNVASRKAHCSSVLRTIVDEKTVTVTVAATTSQPVIIAKRQAEMTGLPHPNIQLRDREYSLLIARDQYIVSGNKPAYASACKNVQDYAVACVCYGVKAAVYRTVTKTVTVKARPTGTACGSNNFCSSTQRCQAGTCVTDECSNPDNMCSFSNSCSDCKCYTTSFGNRCNQLGSCAQGPFCYKQSDCPDGLVCLLQSCCTQGDGRGVCVSVLTCPNVLQPRYIFAPRGANQMMKLRDASPVDKLKQARAVETGRMDEN